MSKAEVDAYNVVDQLAKQKALAKEQHEFRERGSELAEAIALSITKIENASRVVLINELFSLLHLLTEESQRQSDEILKFTKAAKTNDKGYLKHRDFLNNLNRHLRKLLVDLKKETVRSTIHELQRKVDELTTNVVGCTEILQQLEAAPSPTNVTPAQFQESLPDVAQTTNIIAKAALTDLNSAKEEEVELKTIFQRARLAFEGNERIRYHKIGEQMLTILDSAPHTRAVGLLLSARNAMAQAREVRSKEILKLLRESRGRWNTPDYTFWLNAAKAHHEAIEKDIREGKQGSICGKGSFDEFNEVKEDI